MFLRLGRDFPACVSHVAGFVVNNHYLFHDSDLRPRLVEWLNTRIRHSYQHRHHHELSWCLLIAGALKIPVEEKLFGDFESIPGSVAFAICGLLREKGLLKFSLSKWGWRSQVKKSGVNGECWLPIYESVLRGWTKDESIMKQVTSDPFFKKLIEKKISFLDDRLFDLAPPPPRPPPTALISSLSSSFDPILFGEGSDYSDDFELFPEDYGEPLIDLYGDDYED